MQVGDLELAAEFCKLVGAPNLLGYLGLDEHAGSEEARARFKARRKFMQGMQGNPKYKREALFLIRHFSSLNEVLGDLEAYLVDARQRAESEHLPVIEMTVRGVLGGSGPVTDDQIAYLRRNAAELGVSDDTFRELVGRLAAQMRVGLPPTFHGGRGGTGEGGPQRTATPRPPEEAPDLYRLLGISPTANADDVRIAYQHKLDALASVADPREREDLRRRLDIARKVLSNEAARRHYDSAGGRTGPPARARDARPGATGASTAPPSPEREPNRPRLEILGEPVRKVRASGGSTRIVLRNGGEGAMPGTVAADVSWLVVSPTDLDPNAREQVVTVTVNPVARPPVGGAGSVTIHTERGERASVGFEVAPNTSALPMMAIGAVVIGLIAMAALVAALL